MFTDVSEVAGGLEFNDPTRMNNIKIAKSRLMALMAGQPG
jgi:hypothetical protein